MVYKFLDKNTSGSGIKNKIISNKELPEELHKPIIRKFKKRKVHSYFDDMQIISKFSKGFRILLCVIDIYRKYAWVISLKDEKGISMLSVKL